MTIYDALKRASAQMYGGEAQTDDLEDEEILALYMQYAQEAFRRVWRRYDPIDPGALPAIVRLPCPEVNQDTELDEYGAAAYDAIADFVTWRMFGTGNMSKQQRGEWFYARFIDDLGRVERAAAWEGIAGDGQFTNIYTF